MLLLLLSTESDPRFPCGRVGKPSSESYGHRGLVGIGSHTFEDVSKGGKVEQSVRGGGGGVERGIR